jgi:hypothetical protein
MNGTSIGQATIVDAVMRPGNNTLNLRAQLNEIALMGQADSLKSGNITVDSTGNSSIFNGQHLTFVEEAFKQNTFHTTLNLLSIIGHISIVNSTGGETNALDLMTGDVKDPELKQLISMATGGNSSASGGASGGLGLAGLGL